MMMLFQLTVGLVALYYGAEWLVRGSASLARRYGLSPLVVGLTVVAYGTSAPELVVSTLAAWRGQGALALGNVVGSNMFNVGCILGLSALILPIRVQSQLVRLDAPIMVGVALGFAALFWDGTIERWEAFALVAGVVAYTVVQVSLARRHGGVGAGEGEVEIPGSTGGVRVDVTLIVGGLSVLVLGSHLFVEGAVALARKWGVSEAVIGLTVVAAGTSLPELAASVVAACRRQADLAIGNIVGSNIYNLLAIVGVAGVVGGPLDGSQVGRIEVALMVAVSVLLLLLIWTGHTLRRWEGLVLLLGYAAYLIHLWPS